MGEPLKFSSDYVNLGDFDPVRARDELVVLLQFAARELSELPGIEFPVTGTISTITKRWDGHLVLRLEFGDEVEE